MHMRFALRGRQFFQLDLRAPATGIRVRAGQVGLDFVVRNNPALLHIDEQHFARLQTPFFDDFFFRRRQHTHFRGHNQAVIRGHIMAGRTQAIAVQRGTDLAPIGEVRRRASLVPSVPHYIRKPRDVIVHQRIAGPSFGYQHHHGVGR